MPTDCVAPQNWRLCSERLVGSPSKLLSLHWLLDLSRARCISMGSVLDAIAAERFIARLSSVERPVASISLTGYHLLPVASKRPELLPAVVLRLCIGSDDGAVVSQAIESVCGIKLEDQCSFQLVRLGARSRPPDFARRVFFAEVSASVAGTAVHLPVELRVSFVERQPVESLSYPSALSAEQNFLVPCQSLVPYTADLMTKVRATADLDTDAGLHFQLAYLVRHYWSKIPVVADKEFKALRGALERTSEVSLTQILQSHRQVWLAAADDQRWAQRWSEFVGLRGYSRMLEPSRAKEEVPTKSARAERSVPPLVGWHEVAEEITQFLYRVD